jgi:hypothetical protein
MEELPRAKWKGIRQMDKFERLNRETREFNNRNIDRFNPSTKPNYSYFDPYKQNNQTYKANNGQYSKKYF